MALNRRFIGCGLSAFKPDAMPHKSLENNTPHAAFGRCLTLGRPAGK